MRIEKLLGRKVIAQLAIATLRAPGWVCLVALIVVLEACDSVSPPAAPLSGSVSASPTPAPTPAPAPSPAPTLPIYPVDPANVRFIPAPSPPSSATDSIVGRYMLEIVVTSTSGLRCESVPDYARRRTYTADVHNLEGRYAVRLYDAYFLVDSGRVGFGCTDRRLPTTGACNQFLMDPINSSSLTVTMVPEDEWRGNEIWEVLPQDGRLLALNGQATASVRDGGVDAVGTGGAWWGNGLPASSYAACGPGDIRLRFERR